MQKGKLERGGFALPVEYDLQTVMEGKKSKTGGTLILLGTPTDTLAKALAELTGANLITEKGSTIWVEFVANHNGKQIEFIATRPKGFTL